MKTQPVQTTKQPVKTSEQPALNNRRPTYLRSRTALDKRVQPLSWSQFEDIKTSNPDFGWSVVNKLGLLDGRDIHMIGREAREVLNHYGILMLLGCKIEYNSEALLQHNREKMFSMKEGIDDKNALPEPIISKTTKAITLDQALSLSPEDAKKIDNSIAVSLIEKKLIGLEQLIKLNPVSLGIIYGDPNAKSRSERGYEASMAKFKISADTILEYAIAARHHDTLPDPYYVCSFLKKLANEEGTITQESIAIVASLSAAQIEAIAEDEQIGPAYSQSARDLKVLVEPAKQASLRLPFSSNAEVKERPPRRQALLGWAGFKNYDAKQIRCIRHAILALDYGFVTLDDVAEMTEEQAHIASILAEKVVSVLRTDNIFSGIKNGTFEELTDGVLNSELIKKLNVNQANAIAGFYRLIRDEDISIEGAQRFSEKPDLCELISHYSLYFSAYIEQVGREKALSNLYNLPDNIIEALKADIEEEQKNIGTSDLEVRVKTGANTITRFIKTKPYEASAVSKPADPNEGP